MTTFNVFLSVSSERIAGFTPTSSTSGTTYYYQYTGGNTNSNNGAVVVEPAMGRVTINITLNGSTEFRIADIQFSGDSAGQLTYQIVDNMHATIYDVDTHSENAYYKVIVSDTTANCSFPCDPPIDND